MPAATSEITPSAESDRFPPALRRTIVVTTLGAVMALLDSTIVNVALRTVSVDLHSSLATIQWLVTAYLLAMAAMIPASGWAATRYGAKRTYIVATAVFTAASLACGLAPSANWLIAFRAVQGLAGGLAGPVAQMIVVRTAGPRLMARVMSVSGLPTILAPVVGPTIGGLLVQHGGWRWIFFVNLPIGLLTVVLSAWLLPRDGRESARPLDMPGLALIAAGSVALTYGLAEIGTAGHAGSPKIMLSLLAGVVLVGVFVWYALRAEHPLVDLRLYRERRYAAASLINFCLGAAIFGAIILMPLYFQIVRHQSAVATGLLLIPQGAGAAVAISYGARFIDRFGGGRTALAGGLISVAATVPFVAIHDDTSYWLLGAVMLARGFGIGACAVPAVAAAYRAISPAAIQDATIQLNVGQRIGGSAGTAIFAAILQGQLAHATGPASQASAFGVAFWWVLAIAIGATAPTLLLAAAE